MKSTILNQLGNPKIGQRLLAGFSLAILVLVGLIAYNCTSLTQLAELQDEGAGRADDAILVTEMAGQGVAQTDRSPGGVRKTSGNSNLSLFRRKL